MAKTPIHVVFGSFGMLFRKQSLILNCLLSVIVIVVSGLIILKDYAIAFHSNQMAVHLE